MLLDVPYFYELSEQFLPLEHLSKEIATYYVLLRLEFVFAKNYRRKSHVKIFIFLTPCRLYLEIYLKYSDTSKLGCTLCWDLR